MDVAGSISSPGLCSSPGSFHRHTSEVLQGQGLGQDSGAPPEMTERQTSLQGTWLSLSLRPGPSVRCLVNEVYPKTQNNMYN